RFKHRPQFLADSSSRHAPHDTVCLAPCPVVLAALSRAREIRYGRRLAISDRARPKNDANGKYCKSTSQAITKNTDADHLVYDCDQAKGILHPHFGPYKVIIQDIQYKKYLRLE
ncbi:hypothetical protein, partial [Ralstonia pseudosolanacearum]